MISVLSFSWQQDRHQIGFFLLTFKFLEDDIPFPLLSYFPPFPFNKKCAYLNWLNLSVALLHPQKNLTFYSKRCLHSPSFRWHRTPQCPHWLLNSPLASSRFSRFQSDCGLSLSESLRIAYFLLCFSLPKGLPCLTRRAFYISLHFLILYLLMPLRLWPQLSSASILCPRQFISCKAVYIPRVLVKSQIINSSTLLFKKVRHSHSS